MIAFDLRCADGHVFEAWFASGAAYEAQRAAGQLSCPACGNADVAKAAMAPGIPAKGNRAGRASPPDFMRALADAQARALRSSTWVGDDFADRARAMHDGEAERAAIHGRATPAEARSLLEDGVAVAPLPFPVVPPSELN